MITTKERTILIQFAESVLTLVLSLTLAVVLGYFVLGKLIVLLLYLKPNSRVPPKWLILPIGFGNVIYYIYIFVKFQRQLIF